MEAMSAKQDMFKVIILLVSKAVGSGRKEGEIRQVAKYSVQNQL